MGDLLGLLDPQQSDVVKCGQIQLSLLTPRVICCGGNRRALTAANYDEAIESLKKRFGNPQLIVNRHMEALLNVAAVSSHHDVKGLRRLHDSVEAHVRGLQTLGVPATAYGGILSSVLVNKSPPEIRLIISREMTGDGWDLDKVMKIIE